jgi:hypothetical protein
MMRQKHAAGLQAKQAKEGYDLTRTAEANRKSEATRAFGLATEKFGLDTEKFTHTKEDASKRWADLVRGRELQAEEMRGGWNQDELDRALRDEDMRGGWTQQELDRELREETLGQENSWRDADRAQRASEFDRNYSIKQADAEYNEKQRKYALEEARRQEVIRKYNYERRFGGGYASGGGGGDY